MPGIRENSPAENAIFTLQISFEIEQWNLRNRLRTLHVTDGLFRALGVPRQFAVCGHRSYSQCLKWGCLTTKKKVSSQAASQSERTDESKND